MLRNANLLCLNSLPGINKQMAVDAAYVPVLSSDEPGAVGLPQDPHGNTMLSCLSSGFLCPLRDTASNCESTLPEPGTARTGGTGRTRAAFSSVADAAPPEPMTAQMFVLQRSSWRRPLSWRTRTSCASWTFAIWVETRWRS